jgi:hypothetical protein
LRARERVRGCSGRAERVAFLRRREHSCPRVSKYPLNAPWVPPEYRPSSHRPPAHPPARPSTETLLAAWDVSNCCTGVSQRKACAVSASFPNLNLNLPTANECARAAANTNRPARGVAWRGSARLGAPRRRLPPEPTGCHVSGWMRRKLQRRTEGIGPMRSTQYHPGSYGGRKGLAPPNRPKPDADLAR